MTLSQTFASFPHWLWIAFAFASGAAVGSFLNVVVARLPGGESLVRPGSHCRGCGQPIAWYDNVPILSWVVLWGRCRRCGARFPVRYAFVELFFACVCGWAVSAHGMTLAALHEVALLGFLTPLALIDLDLWLLPHSLTRSGIGVGLLLALVSGREAVVDRLLGAAIGYSSLVLFGFVAERIAKREALGGGDPWLFGLIGAFLGLKALLPVLLLASLQGSLVGGAMLLVRRWRGGGAPVDRLGDGSTSSPGPSTPDSGLGDGTTPSPTPSPLAGKGPGVGADSPIAADDADWVPPATAIPFGPFLALAAVEVHHLPWITRAVFPF